MREYLLRIQKKIDSNEVHIFFLYLIFVAVISVLFYNSFIPIIPGTVSFIYFKKIYREKKMKKETLQIKKQFASVLDSISAALSAGYSLPNAFSEAYEDINKLYGKESKIFIYLGKLILGMELNRNLDTILKEFGEKCGIEEAVYFSNVICLTRKEGGNIINVIKDIRTSIYEKIEIQRQIEISIASKKNEACIMGIMPIMILAYLRLFSDGFFEPMYGNVRGIIIMTTILIIYGVLIIIMDKVCCIKV